MQTKLYKELYNIWINRKDIKYISGFLVLLSLPLVYALVYFTGGITYVYSHTMYIPILLAGIFLGPRFGLMVGVIAGILMGPIMPLNVTEGTNQAVTNWLYRMIIFSLMGFISGFASNILRNNVKKIDDLSSKDSETGIPNTNYLRQLKKHITEPDLSLFSIIISNSNNIKDVLGVDVYHQLLKDIHIDLTHQKRKMVVIQPDKGMLWVIMPRTNILDDLFFLETILEKSRSVHHIPLYVDYAIGGSIYTHLTDDFSISTFIESDVAARHAQINNLPSFIFDDGKLKKRQDYELVSGFKKALDENQTFLVFQPKIHLKTKKVHALEALIRWNHPTKGIIPPDRFIPLIEETKLIHLLTDWVLEEALKMLIKLQNTQKDLSISINISCKNLYDPQFYARTMSIIGRYEVDLSKLEFEITETQIMKNPDEAIKVLKAFSKKKIKISLDDFGSGYSSLAYLTRFPIDVIKIDRMFMKSIMEKPQIQQIVASTINLSKELGYLVVAEGIEEEETAVYLESIDCDYAQGYYFAKPMKEEDLLTYLSTQNN
ncbi:MAG: EAL domain-containing protein [Acholeplasma sp.]|nr:EAL domain-containing protein [Acholeplasma sp.]